MGIKKRGHYQKPRLLYFSLFCFVCLGTAKRAKPKRTTKISIFFDIANYLIDWHKKNLIGSWEFMRDIFVVGAPTREKFLNNKFIMDFAKIIKFSLHLQR